MTDLLNFLSCPLNYSSILLCQFLANVSIEENKADIEQLRNQIQNTSSAIDLDAKGTLCILLMNDEILDEFMFKNVLNEILIAHFPL